MNRGKRKVICIGVILITALCITACAETPDKKVVVDRSEGLAEENILSKETEGTPKEIDAPEHWKETIERSKGYVTLTADCDIQLPEIYNTPVYSYEIEPMTDELLDKLCTYFAAGGRLYEDPAMTKNELNTQREKMVNYKGAWGYFAGRVEQETRLKDMVVKVDELIEQAPDKKPKRTYIEASLMAPKQVDVEYVRQQWEVRKSWHSWYYDTEEKIGLTARVDKGRVSDPIIRAINYNDKVGSTTGFVFNQGVYIDEIELKGDLNNQKAFNTGNEAYLNYLTGEMEHVKDETFTKEDALKEVDKILKDLSIKGVAVTDCVKAICISDSESWAGLDEENLPKKAGYSVYLSRKAGDLLGYPFPRGVVPYDNLPEETYAPSFLTEQIHIVVTEEGVQRFEWLDISKHKDTIAENTRLLPFADITERLADHLLYAMISMSGGEKAEEDEFTFEVRNVQLRAANVSAYEDISAVWLVPVWVFDMDVTARFKLGDQVRETALGSEIVVLNAIDGGYVRPQY